MAVKDLGFVIDLNAISAEEVLTSFMIGLSFDERVPIKNIKYVVVRVSGEAKLVCEVGHVTFRSGQDKNHELFFSKIKTGLTGDTVSFYRERGGSDRIKYVSEHNEKDLKAELENGAATPEPAPTSILDLNEAKSAIGRRYGVSDKSITITITV